MADFAVPERPLGQPAGGHVFRSTAMPMKMTQPQIQKHDGANVGNVQLGAGPSGLANNVDHMNPMAMAERDQIYGP